MATGDALPQLPTCLGQLVRRYALPPPAGPKLLTLLELISRDRAAPTTIREPVAVLRDHLADSLVALDLPAVRNGSSICDIGSGAGLPGLPLAIALPSTRVWLIDSREAKASFIERAARKCDLTNTSVVHARIEEWQPPSPVDVVTARALAPLDVVAEYAAPLLRVGGALVSWRGRRDLATDGVAVRAAEVLGLQALEPLPVTPYPGAYNRNLYLMVKVRPTPSRFPRRAGMARKRPLGARTIASDRPRR